MPTLCVLLALSLPLTATAQLAPPSSGGFAKFDHHLHRASDGRRVLLIGAHPDDEDTELLAALSLGHGVEAAYLSLSRGEGGQNLIGRELGISLGLLRSQELAAARHIDGAGQFFTRAYDFGFSRSLEETNRFWNPDSVLKDVVRVVRRFRPHIIVSTFSGTARDGHGQHQAAGVAAREAFAAAADPARFPELLREEGLAAWRASKFYRSTRFDAGETSVTIGTGQMDPVLGRSYYQIAMESRSQHRSQDFGRLQSLGPRETSAQLLESRVADEGSFFGGIPADSSWAGRLADSLRASVTPARLETAVPVIAAALARRPPDGVARELQAALGAAAGLVMDATATVGELIPGQRVEITVAFFNGGSTPVTVDSVGLITPAGWNVEPVESQGSRTVPGVLVTRRFLVDVPANAEPTQPYFLKRPLIGALYDWTAVPPSTRGLPFGPPPIRAAITVGILGAPVRLEREVSYQYNDQVVGEVRRPLGVVPAISVVLAPDSLVWPAANGSERVFEVTLASNGGVPIAGQLRIETGGAADPPPQRFAFEAASEPRTFRFALRRPAAERLTLRLRAVARSEDGRVFADGVTMVEYPHIRPVSWVRPAASLVRVAPVTLPALARVGYVRGAADRVPEALERLGLHVAILGEADLASGDLSRYPVIVVGSRAYEADSALIRLNARLLEYVHQGGLVIVQYQQYDYIRRRYAPFPLTIAQPHDRVTDETAPVRPLAPDHPVFSRPNRIGAEDWEGWPQERGLYFARTWDPAYRPLLETHDPGMPPLEGGLLVARYGEGTYVYTGLSFFRALPAGVPGATRLFLNLLALRSADVP